MKSTLRSSIWVGLCALVAMPHTFGMELITNGGFETGDFAGWTAETNADGSTITELTPWSVSGAGGGWFLNTFPLAGLFDAYNGFDGDAGLVYELHQDVAIPAGHTAFLTSNHRIVFDSLGILSALDRVFEISIRDISNALLQTLYSESVNISGFSMTDLGWNNQVFDISAFSGSTVRVHFREFIPESFTGPANIEIDEISLLVTPIPEPASGALACIAAAGYISGRRRCK